MACRRYQKSTLYAYTQASQSVEVNLPVAFNNSQKTGCSIELETPNIIELCNPGLYLVEFNGSAATSGTAGDITVQLQRNGVNVPGALATNTSSATTDIESLSFSTIIDVLPSCCAVNNQTNLAVINSGVAATFANVTINIVKLA